jgi:hypothetical protein
MCVASGVGNSFGVPMRLITMVEPNRNYVYVEIKCKKLDATVLYSWLPPFVVGAWFSSCQYGVELRVVCPVCGLLQQHPSV